MSARLEFRILGPLEVLYDGRPVDLGTPRQRALLMVMLLHADEAVSRERLIDEVWGEQTPASAPNMVQVYISRLRKALGREVLVTQSPGYVLRVGGARIDATLLATLVGRAREAMERGRPGEARALLEEAGQLWRGPPLVEFTYESFAQAEVTRLDELRLEAIDLRVDADLALGGHAALVGELERLVALYPLRERFRSRLMLALYRSGRQAEALDAYRAARKTLGDELGIEPSPELRQLEFAILAQDRELDGPRDAVSESTASHRPAGNHLPAELTSLIGRARDIQRVRSLLGKHRLVTLVGPGGVGKTRVAQRAAGEVTGDFRNEVCYVDLAAVDPGGDVAGAVSSAARIADRPGTPTVDSIIADLRDRRVLLVLDNCEHVLPASARIASRLLGQCPGVRILATSREPLGIGGERISRLEPLATTGSSPELPPAVELFLERAEAHGASWEDPESVVPTIREVCVRLDGIPLAIELAACRTRAISPAQLLARLDDRFRLLACAGQPSTHARQQTLEAAIAWSYDLLSSQEQATLRRLAVFHGGFSLTAAVAVCADTGSELDTVERVTALVDRSVVSIERRGEDDRYRLLESIGLYARQRLDEHAEADAARDRHSSFFLRLVRQTSDQIQTGEPAPCAAVLDAEQDNVTAALAWCLEGAGDPDVGAGLAANLGWHWTLRGRSNAARSWLERARDLGGRVDAPNLVAVHVASAVLAYATSDLNSSRASATEAVSVARAIGREDLLAEALAQLALVNQALGAATEAVPAAEELRSLQPRLSNPRTQAMALLGTAQVALAGGDAQQASIDASAARTIARRSGDFVRAANSGFWLAYALALGAALPSARAVIAEAARDAARSGYPMLVVDNLMAEVSLALADNDLDAASQRLPRALQMYSDQQRWDDFGSSLRLAAGVELKRGLTERSAILLGASLRRTDHLDFQDELLLPDLGAINEMLTERLGTEKFAETAQRGATMSLDELSEFVARTSDATGPRRVEILQR